ncbi:MAG: U32 family peptidase [Firmicutes bacterium]|nr:U32 family peptidase [Bacillota bacterium]
MKIPELLAPAGNMEKGLTAIEYGADALYLAGQRFGMRAQAGNFTLVEIKEILDTAHRRGVKIYVTVNTFPHNDEIDELPGYLEDLAELGVDGIILADPGVLRLAQKYAPNIPLHLSTQANTVNYAAAQFWVEAGISRLVLARELSREAIREMRRHISAELEIFVHGAMCMAYSGRCLLSTFLTGRDANRGACAQSCRWKYAVVEEKRPGEFFSLEEDALGTYIFNSKDLCLIDYIPDLVQIGVDSLKIEGRMKSSYYVATVVRAYRAALDLYAQDPENYRLPDELRDELHKVSHRPYWAGFFVPTGAGIHHKTAALVQTHDVVGVVQGYDEARGEAVVLIKNRLRKGETVEIMEPRGPVRIETITNMVEGDLGRTLDEAHANFTVRIPMPPTKPLSMLRVERK